MPKIDLNNQTPEFKTLFPPTDDKDETKIEKEFNLTADVFLLKVNKVI
jgi:hypothetical protein